MLVAAAFHYCDCVATKDEGVYDLVDGIMWNRYGGGAGAGVPMVSLLCTGDDHDDDRLVL